MSTCTMQTGMLLWKKFCGAGAVGNCRQCHAFVCARHGAQYGDGSLVCTGCGAEVDTDDSTGTVFGTSGGLFGRSAAAAETTTEQATTESWHGGGDSGGSFDSGGSDSGGGDSGGSSD